MTDTHDNEMYSPKKPQIVVDKAAPKEPQDAINPKMVPRFSCGIEIIKEALKILLAKILANVDRINKDINSHLLEQASEVMINTFDSMNI